MKKRAGKYLLFTFLSAVSIGFVLLTNLGKKAHQYIQTVEIPDSIPDGSYSGTYQAGIFTLCKIEFIIRNNAADSVIVHKLVSTPGHPARKKLIHQVEKKKNLNVDVITGATYSSSFLKAAVVKALME